MRRRRRLVVRSAVAVAIVAAAYVWALPQIADYGSVGDRLAAISGGWWAALVVVALLDVVSSGLPWHVLLPQLSWREAIGFTQVSTSLQTIVPGGAPVGMAISYGILRRLRVSAGAAGFTIALVGVWSQVTILLYPLVGVALVLGTGELSGAIAAVAGLSAGVALLIGLAVAAGLRSRDATLRLGRLAHAVAAALARLLRREPPAWEAAALVRLRDERLGLLRRRWPALTVTTLANQLTAYVLLDFCLRAVGVSVHVLSPAETFLAWAVGRLIASLPLTPGGIGVVELGLIGTLVGFGGGHAEVVAAVLLYRALIVLPTFAAGGIAYAGWHLGGMRAVEEA